MNVHINLPRRGARLLVFMCVGGASGLAALPSLADLAPALDRLSVSVGVLSADPKLNLSLNSTYGDLGSGDMGLGKETMPRIKANLMIFDSQGVSFDYYQYRHSYTGVFSNTTNVNGTDITAAGNAFLDVKLDVAKLAYKFWMGSGDTVFGAGAGAGYYKLGLNASATASINSTSSSAQGDYNDSALAPLLEFSARHAFGPDLRVFVDASGVKKSNGRLSGSIYNTAVGIEWFPTKNVGAVLDYSTSQINLSRADTVDINLKLKVQGPSAFIKVRY